MIIRSPGVIYRFISIFLFLFWVVHALRHGSKNNLPGYLQLRLKGVKSVDSSARIWVHAASLGEVEAITPLVKELIAGGQKILFSSFTASGFQAIQRQFEDTVEAVIIPIDIIWACKRFFYDHRIKLCLLMETELWPELLYQAATRDIPVLQVNARLSRKSVATSSYFRSLLARTLSYVTLHLTRSEFDRDNILSLGADADRIRIIGNLKLHVSETGATAPLIKPPYILLASSHEPEELLMLKHRPVGFNRLIVIAPRHPKRSQSIQQQMLNLGVNFKVRSLSQQIDESTEVYLADTLGELKDFMAYAILVVMGGSFDQTGGHNIIEPASFGCATITGPSDSNIREDIAMLGNGYGILQVENMEQCWRTVRDLLDDSQALATLGTRAKKMVEQHCNIAQKYLEEIKPYL